jgi:hypothetical protein
MTLGKWDNDGNLNFAPGILRSSELNTAIQEVFMPIGSIVAWDKSLTGTPSLPAGWVECDGSVLSDSESPLNGQTIPSLNATNKFLRGSTTSGGTGGADSHSHTISTAPVSTGAVTAYYSPTGSNSNLPEYYSIVWIMRVK